MPAKLSERELRLLRMRSQRLLPGFEASSVADAAAKTLTIQAQDVSAAALGVRVRTVGLTAAAAKRQAARRSVCRSWLMRNTLFLFASGDLAWMRPLLAERPLTPAMRRLEQEGVGEAKVERVLEKLAALVADGPLPRAEAIAAIASLGIEPGDHNQRTYWLIHAAALRGVIVVRPALERDQSFVSAPPDQDLGREGGFGRLARRYLDAYGPATVEDFAAWGKLTKADARLGWEHAGRTVEIETALGPMTALPGRLDPPSFDQPIVRLLPVWDHYLLGWKGRGLTVPDERDHGVRQGAGRTVAFADGLAFATWRLERGAGSVTVVVEPFDRLPRGVKPGLEREAADLGRFLEVEATLRVAR